MIHFTAEVAGVEVLNRAFNRIEQYVDDFRNVWPNVIRAFYEIEGEQFASEGARGASGKWAPLSPAYAKYKAVQFPGQKILAASDDLVNSLTSPDALGAIIRPERNELTLGSSVPYALAHQKGTSRMPARPPISLSEDDKRRMQKEIQRGLVAFTRQAGFTVEEKAA